MSAKDPARNDVRIVKARNLLQAKVGVGSVDEALVSKSQAMIESNSFDFKPLADKFLEELATAIMAARGSAVPLNRDVVIDNLTLPVMQMKANAAMFGYGLISDLAEILLNFLEAVKTVDTHVLDIADAHYATIRVVVANQMKGDGGAYGLALRKELREACNRYFTREMGLPISAANDAFFLDF